MREGSPGETVTDLLHFGRGRQREGIPLWVRAPRGGDAREAPPQGPETQGVGARRKECLMRNRHRAVDIHPFASDTDTSVHQSIPCEPCREHRGPPRVIGYTTGETSLC
ncbi:Urea Transporter 1 [Manis pentadactyla]|nr:Urea Transporter 1 [Manis pentadactyla]